MNPASVMIVHSLPIFREGIRQNLTTLPGFRVIGEAENAQQAIRLVDEAEPDLVIMEVDLPGVNGIEAARVIRRAHPRVAVILLGAQLSSDQVLRAMRAGVAAYIPGNILWNDLLEAIRTVRNGAYPINELLLSMPAVATDVLDAFRQMVADGDDSMIYSPLSPREREILELVAAGHSNKSIAARLEISNQTVKNHVSSILRKLAVNDRTNAVVYAVRRGWIRMSQPDDASAA